MCKAASLIVGQHAEYFHPVSDGHQDIIEFHKLCADGVMGVNLVPVEISPPRMNFSLPFEQWVFRVDLDKAQWPKWFDADDAEVRVRAKLPEWFKKLDGVRLAEAYAPINPLKIRRKPLAKNFQSDLKLWASVWDSVGDSVWDSVGASVGDSVGASVGASVGDSVWASVWDSVGASVWDSVGASVGASVWASVWAYVGSLFSKITKWKYAEKLGAEPWEPLRRLWLAGYVPSYDGTKWRLHAGVKAEIVWEWTPGQEGFDPRKKARKAKVK